MNAQTTTISCSPTQESVEQIGLHATALSLSEVGLGGVMHALHIPFTGTLLSLNQIFLLTRSLSQVSSKYTKIVPETVVIANKEIVAPIE